jgi:hypothetical protein
MKLPFGMSQAVAMSSVNTSPKKLSKQAEVPLHTEAEREADLHKPEESMLPKPVPIW